MKYLLSSSKATNLNYNSSILDYFPYGKVLRSYINGDEERYLTTQHERDAETGLDYRGARYYDSDVARFLSLDPLASDYLEWSDYNYVKGNPIVFVDPDGNDVVPASEKSLSQFMEYANSLLRGSKYEGKAAEFFAMYLRDGTSITSKAGISVKKIMNRAEKAGVIDEGQLNAIGDLYSVLSGHRFSTDLVFLYLEPGSRTKDYTELEKMKIYDFIFSTQGGRNTSFLNYLSVDNEIQMGYIPSEDAMKSLIGLYKTNSVLDIKGENGVLSYLSSQRNQEFAAYIYSIYSEKEFAEMVNKFLKEYSSGKRVDEGVENNKKDDELYIPVEDN